MTHPYISVIVTAYNRRRYLPEALGSVKAQNIDESEYEVIVVSNFEGSYEGISNLRWITTDEEGLGAKLVIGFEEARGELVSILEDDDRWLPDKLRYVRDFMKTTSVDYLHNNMIYVRDQEVLPSSRQDFLRNCSFSMIVGPRFKGLDLRKFKRLWLCAWNNSSITLRRDFVLQDEGLVKFLKGLGNAHGVDWLLTLYSIENGRAAHVPRALTLYNTHNWYEFAKLSAEESCKLALLNTIKISLNHIRILDFLSGTCKDELCKRIIDMLKVIYVPPYVSLTNNDSRLSLRIPRQRLMALIAGDMVSYFRLALYFPKSFLEKISYFVLPDTMIMAKECSSGNT